MEHLKVSQGARVGVGCGDAVQHNALALCGVESVVKDVAMCAYGAVFDTHYGDWVSDAVGVSVAYRVVASGVFAGPQLHDVCVRTEVRLCALDTASMVEEHMRESVYNGVVAKLEEGMRLNTTDYLAYMRQYELVSQLYTSAAVPQSARLLVDGSVPVGYRVIPSSTVAVLTTSRDSVVDKSLLPRGLVIPQLVYGGFLSLAHGSTEPCSVSVGYHKGMDGVHYLLKSCDVSNMIPYGQLPDGKYALPGVGCYVDRSVIIAHLEQIFIVPLLVHTDGYCYVSLLPPEMRVIMASKLGKDVAAGDLRAYCPVVGSWAACVATVTRLDKDGAPGGVFHVDTPGSLPEWVADTDRLGAFSSRWGERSSSVDANRDRVMSMPSRPDVAAMANSRIQQMVAAHGVQAPPYPMGDLGLSVQQPQPHRVASPFGHMGMQRAETPAFMQSLAPRPEVRARGASFGGAASAFTVDVRSAQVSSTGWLPVDDPGAEEWSERLSSGAPVGHTAMRGLVKARAGSIPPLMPALGQVVVVPPVGPVHGGRAMSWSERNVPLVSWKCEYTSFRDKGWYYTVPAVSGVWMRYEFSFSQEIAVNGVSLPGRRTAVWSNGPVVVHYHGGEAHLWRAWSNTGVGVLGPEFALAGVTALPMVRSYVRGFTAHMAKVLKLRGHSPGMYKRYAVDFAVPSGTTAVLLVFPDSEPPGCARVAVRADRLTAVIAHGAVVPAAAGVVELLMLARQLTLSVVVMGHNTKVSCEVACAAPGAGATVDTSRMLPAPPTLAGMSPVLPQ